MNFPTFDGESTRLWISRAEYYFDTFTIDPALWVKLVGMHFTGAAARWIQSVDSKLKQLSWPLFCKLLHDRFGRDQHETLLRQMFHIHQTSTVVDYVDRFSALMDELAAYESNTDICFTTLLVSLMGFMMIFVPLSLFKGHQTSILCTLFPCCRRKWWDLLTRHLHDMTPRMLAVNPSRVHWSLSA